MSKLFSLSILALGSILLASGDAAALKKRPGFKEVSCTCQCYRDKGTKLRSTVKTTIQVADGSLSWQECGKLNGGGCRFMGVSPGTLQSCDKS